MAKVEVVTKEITSANILKVSVGTNCPQGGDAGHGGRTYFKLEEKAGGSIAVKINGKNFDLCNGGQLEIILSGDTECETFLESLRFAVDILERQISRESVNVNTVDLEIA